MHTDAHGTGSIFGSGCNLVRWAASKALRRFSTFPAHRTKLLFVDVRFGEGGCGNLGVLALVPPASQFAIWAIGAATIAAILVRPRGLPEWCSAAIGAALLVVARLVPLSAAGAAAWDGLDVYLFLAGMLALSELARIEGVFDWLAGRIVPAARGSTGLLFAGVYASGIAVTALLSNDGTILLLTPAVLAAVQRTKIAPLPFLVACALVANAASYVLPIANPANLVLFRVLPTLGPWFVAFGLSALAAIAVTYVLLFGLFRRDLRRPHEAGNPPLPLSGRGRLAGLLVAISAALLVTAAAFGWPVGRTAFLTGGVSLLLMALADWDCARAVLREGPWSIIPLVAALFVIVAALDRSGILNLARDFFRYASQLASMPGKLLAGGAVALADNLLNNLPVGVIARYSIAAPNVAPHVAHAALVAVDLGPNFSVTGSLATLLWLLTIRRAGVEITPLRFFCIGAVVTVPALIAALLFVS